MIAMILIVFATLSLFGSTAHAQAAGTAQQAGGTINILLANSHGLIAVTDSKLSSVNGDAGEGQKIFKIDDQTICTIAGFYSDTGPTNQQIFPAYTEVPKILRIFIKELPNPSDLTLQDKAERLAGAFRFSLEMVANIDQAAKLSGPPSISELTLAGFEAGQLKIEEVTLTPSIEDGRVTYSAERKEDIVSKALVIVVRGRPTVAKSLLKNAVLSRSKDPILSHYAEAMKNDGGESLSLKDLSQIAHLLERETALQVPQVGGAMEQATLSGGKIESFEQPVQSDDSRKDVYFAVTSDITFSAARKINPDELFKGRTFFVMSISPNAGALIRVRESDCVQILDNLLILESTLSRCTLMYNGSPEVLFDKSNKVDGSELILYSPASPDSSFVKQIRSDFPGLAIIDKTKGNTK